MYAKENNNNKSYETHTSLFRSLLHTHIKKFLEVNAFYLIFIADEDKAAGREPERNERVGVCVRVCR